jgi:hypothetical protein
MCFAVRKSPRVKGMRRRQYSKYNPNQKSDENKFPSFFLSTHSRIYSSCSRDFNFPAALTNCLSLFSIAVRPSRLCQTW